MAEHQRKWQKTKKRDGIQLLLIDLWQKQLEINGLFWRWRLNRCSVLVTVWQRQYYCLWGCKSRATKSENRSWLLLGPKLLGGWSEGKLCLLSLEKKIFWCDLVDDFQNDDGDDQGKLYQARVEQQGKGRQDMSKQAANILNNITGGKQGSCQVELLQLKGNKCGRCYHERQLNKRLCVSSKDTWTYFNRRIWGFLWKPESWD